MDVKNMSMYELVELAKDMLATPYKYGLTEERIRQWKFKNISEAASMLHEMPECQRDEVSNGIISVYDEMKKAGLKT